MPRKLYTGSLPFYQWLPFIESEVKAHYGEQGIHGLERAFGSGERTRGVHNFDEALAVVRQGWPEGLELAKKFADLAVDKIVPRLCTDLAIAPDVTGAAYDTGSYISGVPECWLTLAESESKPTVTILVDAFISYGVSEQALILRGAATIALVLALQKAGYAVNISVVAGSDSTCEDKTLWARVTLEDANGGPLDIDRLVSVLAHPASTRFLLYAYASLVGEQDKPHADAEHYSAHYAHPCPWKADITIPRLVYGDADFGSEEAMHKWVQARFAEITGGTVRKF